MTRGKDVWRRGLYYIIIIIITIIFIIIIYHRYYTEERRQEEQLVSATVVVVVLCTECVAGVAKVVFLLLLFIFLCVVFESSLQGHRGEPLLGNGLFYEGNTGADVGQAVHPTGGFFPTQNLQRIIGTQELVSIYQAPFSLFHEKNKHLSKIVPLWQTLLVCTCPLDQEMQGQ